MLPASLSESDMIDTVTRWFDLASVMMNTDNSRLAVQAWLKALIRQGTIPAVRVIEWANGGVADADIALRQIAAEMLDRGETPPTTIAGYAAQALNKPQVARRKGGDVADNWLRDCCIAVLVSLAVERWHPHLPMSRNRASKSPSACSVVSAALIKRRINIGERRVEKIHQQFAALLPAHAAWRASLLSAPNQAL